MRFCRLIFGLALVTCAEMTPTWAATPGILSYQGRVLVSGAPFAGTGKFKFALVDSDGTTATTTFWANDNATTVAGSTEPGTAIQLTVTNGLYSVILGNTDVSLGYTMQGIPATVFSNSNVRLRVWFDDGTNGSKLLSPDQRIASVGYAMTSTSSDNGVPAGFSIIGSSATPPPGYSFTGLVLGGNAWTAKNSAPTGRARGTGAAVNGKAYVFNGTDDLGNNINSTEQYDPVANTWATKKPSPTIRFHCFSAAANNKIYVIGGSIGSPTGINEEYDPVTDTWATKASMPTPRQEAGCVSFNNKIYVFGGYNGAVLSVVEIYDPSNDSWSTGTSMPTARSDPAAAAANNKIYVIGGDLEGAPTLSVNEEYDPVGNSWQTRPAMPTSRYATFVGAANGKVYVMGGSLLNANANQTLTTAVEEYDPVLAVWTARTPMPTARYFGASASINGSIYTMGGANLSGGKSNYLQTNEAYNPLNEAQFYVHSKN